MGTALPTRRLPEHRLQKPGQSPRRADFWQNVGRTSFVYPVNGLDQLGRQMLHFCDGNDHVGGRATALNDDCESRSSRQEVRLCLRCPLHIGAILFTCA